MNTKNGPFVETVIRYGSYPLILGATAVVLFGGLAAGWPYFPTVPLTVAAALACVALLERRLPFHSAWGRDQRDSVCDAIHAVVTRRCSVWRGGLVNIRRCSRRSSVLRWRPWAMPLAAPRLRTSAPGALA